MKCLRCGIEEREDQKICSKCGSILNFDFSYDQKMKKFKYSTKIGLTCACILVIVFGFLYTEYKNMMVLKKLTPISELKLDPNSIHYINNLYISDYRHYTYLLDDYQKEIYMDLLTAIKNFDKQITVDTTKMNTKYPSEYLLKIYDTLIMDHPEILHLGDFKNVSTSVNSRVIGIKYVMDKETLNSAITETKRIIGKIKNEVKNKSDLEKAKYIYEYLSQTSTYSDTNSINQSAYSSISGKYNSNYLGYARASQILLQNMKIDSLMTIGTISNNTHAWNLIKLNQKYYYFDITASSYNNEDLRFNGFLKNNHNYNFIYSKLIPKVQNNY